MKFPALLSHLYHRKNKQIHARFYTLLSRLLGKIPGQAASRLLSILFFRFLEYNTASSFYPYHPAAARDARKVHLFHVPRLLEEYSDIHFSIAICIYR